MGLAAEQTWLARAQQGEAEAFDALLAPHLPRAYRTAWLITHDPEVVRHGGGWRCPCLPGRALLRRGRGLGRRLRHGRLALGRRPLGRLRPDAGTAEAKARALRRHAGAAPAGAAKPGALRCPAGTDAPGTGSLQPGPALDAGPGVAAGAHPGLHRRGAEAEDKHQGAGADRPQPTLLLLQDHPPFSLSSAPSSIRRRFWHHL